MYKQRLIILLGLICLGFLVLIGRLGVLQLLHGSYYRSEAEEALRSVQLLPGERGLIVDRNGVILAQDEACHQVLLDYGFIAHCIATDGEYVARRLQAYWDAHDEQVDSAAFNEFRTKLEQTQAMARRLDEELNWPGRQRRRLRRTLDIDAEQAAATFDRRFRYTRELIYELAREFDNDLDETMADILRKFERWSRHAGRPVREQREPHVVIAGLGEDSTTALRPLEGKTVGMRIEPAHRRHYPHGPLACHIIGLTTPVFREDAEQYNLQPDEAPWLDRKLNNYLDGDVIGKTGVEGMYEAVEIDGQREPVLRPARGYRRLVQTGETELTVPARNGRTVRLTIDIDLQAKLTALMARTGGTGSIVVIDVPTGEVLAMVSWPVFDLNTYREHRAELEFDAVNLPMIHRAVAAAYAPGSTVKPITALAGLGAGKTTPGTTITCTGHNTLARNGKPACWIARSHSTHGPLALVEALMRSCNIYFVQVGHRLGAPLLTYWMGLFGFGEQPGTGLPGEKAGTLATEVWLQSNRLRGFVPSDSWFMSIGQGIFAATPLQVAAAHAAIARDGVYLSPKIIKGIETPDGRPSDVAPPKQVRRDLPIAAEHVAAVREGMYRVVNERHGGTAYKYWHSSGPPLDVEVCGKTGTAQVPPLRVDSNGDGRIDANDRIVRQGDHAWFAGFAPYRDPKIAFVVLLEYEGSGGRNAGPVAKEVVRACLEAGYLDPDEVPRAGADTPQAVDGTLQAQRTETEIAGGGGAAGTPGSQSSYEAQPQRGETGAAPSGLEYTRSVDRGLAPTAIPVAPLWGNECSHRTPLNSSRGEGDDG